MYKSKNRYYKISKISEARFRRLLKAFALDMTASDAARLTGISTRSVNTIYLKMRQRIAEYCEAQSPYSGEVELDESTSARNAFEANVDEVPAARRSYLVFSSVMAMCIPRLCRMRRKGLY